jgi:hypothetical protein
MTRLKGIAILGGLLFAGVTLLGSLPASGKDSFLLVSTKRVRNACRAVEGLDDRICTVTAGLIERLGGLDPETEPTADQLERAVRKMRPFVRRGLRQECCDGPCVRECSGGQRGCFSDDQCPAGETCLPCPDEPCQTLCEEYRGEKCDGCLAMVSNLEAFLATNRSAELLADVMDGACDGKFDDPAITQQCKDEIHDVTAVVIDTILANAPPAVACSSPALRACPALPPPP